MLTKTYKILVLLQSLKYASQKQSPLYLSTYWQTTYVSDKVPDYWNHGAIYFPGLQETKREDIFPAWLRKTTTDASNQVKETTFLDNGIEDKVFRNNDHDDIEVAKKSTDEISMISNRYITTSSSKIVDTTPVENDDIQVFKTSTNKMSSISNRYSKTTSSQKPEMTPIEDYDIEVSKTSTNHVSSINNRYTITANKQTAGATTVEDDDIEVFNTKMSKKLKTNSIPYPTTTTMPQTKLSNPVNAITWISFPKPALKPGKNDFTRPEFETTIDDYEAHPTSITINPTVTTVKESNPIFISVDSKFYTTPTDKKNFARPERKTTTDDEDAHPIYTKMAATSTVPYETTFDYAAHRNSTRMTPEYDTTTDSASMIHESSTSDDDSTKYNYDTTTLIEKESLTPTTAHITPSKANGAVIRAVNKDTTDPFSVFLRKLLIILSVKRLEDLPLLINHFKEYLWMLLTAGELGKLGLYINSYLAKRVIILDKLPTDDVRKYFNYYRKLLANRYKELGKDVNDILDYMDDTYDESEEEAMQAVLYEASEYPNTKNINKIAQGFVDYVFIKPLKRVVGTTRGNILFGMITEAVKKRDHLDKDEKRYNLIREELRRKFNFGITRKHLQKALNRRSDEVPAHNKLYKKTDEGIEDKSDTVSGNDDENFSGNSNETKSLCETNEHSDKTESDGTKDSRYYTNMNYDNIIVKNNKQRGAFANVNQATMKTSELKNSPRKIRTLGYSVKTKEHMINYYNEMQRNSFSRKNSRTTTTNSADLDETTADASNIEMELKARIYDAFKRMNAVNYSASGNRRQGVKSTVNVEYSQEYDAERVLKKNIYKAVKKLLN